LFGCGGCFLRGFDEIRKFRDGVIDDDFIARFGAGLTRTNGAVDCLGRILGSHENVDVFGLCCGWGSIKCWESTTLFSSKFGLAFME